MKIQEGDVYTHWAPSHMDQDDNDIYPEPDPESIMNWARFIVEDARKLSERERDVIPLLGKTDGAWKNGNDQKS
ncbi:hypothetical protein HU830_00950 [Lactobacillus sp. DCY120]|uniref:Uncharacterized protein n=1 Tax=Bombilactobacillus apium TaxID=2675299 RepID=A0A850RAC3_9LACO|nr:hypothetical protein [Bombilactobacillus apium]NVY95778.1 hypothetical protein [Bombilactobacillus apium]